jgi:hypothetical protein
MNDMDLLSTADVAKVLNLSADMVRVLAREGRLQPSAQSVRGVRLFRRSDVEALRAERAGRAGHTHGVQFYEDDDFLIGVVAGFLGDGLRAGAPAIAIATRGHRNALRKRLESDGFDIRDAAWSSRVALLDAEETLTKFMVDGRPNPTRFRAVASDVFKRMTAGAPRRRPRVYGEMVDLLWRSDQATAAIKLEGLWNEFGRKFPFTLLCGYAMNNFRQSEQAEGFKAICRAHSRVVPTERFPHDAQEDQLRVIAELQQKAGALDAEVERRERAEASLHAALAERDRAVKALRLSTQRHREAMGREGPQRGREST